MDDLTLLDLLECPLCLGPLGAAAKVLPCQHTFCRPCLRAEEARQSPPLRCPECRTPAGCPVEELPTNLLLARLLEGLCRSPRYGWSRYADRTDTEPGPRTHTREPVFFRYVNNPGEISDPEELNRKPYISGADDSWNYADSGEADKFDSANATQSLEQTPELPPLCRAMFDFDSKDLDSKDCLTFLKGDVITVIRKVDGDWIEGRLGHKVGIFPLQYTEPNSVARRLLERRRGSGASESHPQTAVGSGGERAGANAGSRPAVSSWTPNAASPNSRNGPVAPPGHTRSQQTPRVGAVPAATTRAAPLLKRHSRGSHRNRPQADRRMSSETPPTITMALINPQDAVPLDRLSSMQHLSISVCAALYSYKPHRVEELELKKGEMVGVYGKFKEGWLRGLSLRTGKVGILPSNYVTPVLRTSAKFLETKPPSAVLSTGSGKRHGSHKAQAVVLDRVNTAGTAPAAGQAPPIGMTSSQPASSSATRTTQLWSKQRWDTVRRAFHPSHRGSVQRGAYRSQNLTTSPQPATQDLGQIYGYGRSPVLPRRRNGIFTNPVRQQGWTTDPLAPSAGGYQAVDWDLGPREPLAAPQSILVKPDSHKNNIDKPAKSVRFITDEAPQTGTWATSPTSGGPLFPASSSGPAILELWNPSAILGRDGNSSVLKDTKAVAQRRSPGHEHATSNGGAFSIKTPASAGPPPSPGRYRVVIGYAAKTDAEMSLVDGEMVLVQKPRQDGRVLVMQESTGRTGLFQNSVLRNLKLL